MPSAGRRLEADVLFRETRRRRRCAADRRRLSRLFWLSLHSRRCKVDPWPAVGVRRQFRVRMNVGVKRLQVRKGRWSLALAKILKPRARYKSMSLAQSQPSALRTASARLRGLDVNGKGTSRTPRQLPLNASHIHYRQPLRSVLLGQRHDDPMENLRRSRYRCTNVLCPSQMPRGVCELL